MDVRRIVQLYIQQKLKLNSKINLNIKNPIFKIGQKNEKKNKNKRAKTFFQNIRAINLNKNKKTFLINIYGINKMKMIKNIKLEQKKLN